MSRFGLAARGLRWRWPMSTALFVAAVVTAAGAALGPLYAQAASESTLRDGLTQAAPAESGLQFEASRVSGGVTENTLSLAQIDSSLADAPAAGSIPGYSRKISTLSLYEKSINGASASQGVGQTALVWRQGFCGQVRFTAGRCPTAVGEAAVSARTAASAGDDWKVGDTLSLATGGTVRVVGVYQADDLQSPYWSGRDYFEAHANAKPPPSVDTLFVARRTLTTNPSAFLQGSEDYPLDPSSIRLKDVPALRAQVTALQKRFADESQVTIGTKITHVLDEAAHQRALVNVSALIVTAQLTLLGWLVLFLMMIDAVEARGAEIALAKLRGLSPPAIWRFGLAEPLAVLAVAMPVGFGLGYVIARIFCGSALLPGTPVVVTAEAPAAVVAAFAGGLIAAVVAARRVVTRPVLAQWRRTTENVRSSRAVFVVEILVSALAVGGLVVLAVDPGAGPLTLLAPALLVVAAALLGSRLIPRAAGVLVAPTRATRRIGTFLASRQVARRPAGLRLAVLLAAAVGLACFGVAGESVATNNRAVRSDAEVGAQTSVSIQYSPAVDPVNAVRRADPDGTWAAAAATWLPDGGAVNGTVLGVDASRIRAVGEAARGGPSVDEIYRDIHSDVVPALTVTGTRIRATITGSGIAPAAAPIVQFNLLDKAGTEIDVQSTGVVEGTHQYAATIPCAKGCSFVGLTWDRPITLPGTMKGTLTLHGLDAGTGSSRALHPLAARLTQPEAWRLKVPQGQATDHVTVDRDGVHDRFAAYNGGFGGIVYASTPYPIPLVATPTGMVAGQVSHARGVMDGYNNTAPVEVKSYSPVLPVVLDFGVVADLTALRTQLPEFDGEASWQVWLGPHAPPDAVTLLKRQGLTVESVSTTSAREADYARQAPGLSLLLLLLASFIGAFLAMGATAVSIAATSRRRSYEMAALRVLRIPRAALYRAAVLEQAILLGGATVIGLPAGIVAALVALPLLPGFATTTPVHLDFVPTAPPIIAFALAFAMLVGATALIAAATVVRQAKASRLREGEE
ncbi:hypothetical protein AX769_16705 [Frondihabitans sp. PAMC 28766]|uniref:FtsX-like permease family protein n=1 Tax=Frondihabitans sp. PAMC 28766 TaxID=1795630 RepID=UPI00078CC591|nr:ABC transporter permease [Frondihabitans sp. PAMC 28766]AMM21474.1 hypothetical protein AX769_16705 [Frondihabitans sp. PAMC 28766]